MKRRGFLKMLGIGAAVPAMAIAEQRPVIDTKKTAQWIGMMPGDIITSRPYLPEELDGVTRAVVNIPTQTPYLSSLCMTATPSIRVAQYEKTEWQYKTVK